MPNVRRAAPAPLAERRGRYSALMSASQPLVAEQVLDAYACSGHRCLLDVGGRRGRLRRGRRARAPHLR
jgi:demethylspheroidene O-methyltransferase